MYIPKHVFQFNLKKKLGRSTFETLYVLTRYIANWQNDRQNANRRWNDRHMYFVLDVLAAAEHRTNIIRKLISPLSSYHMRYGKFKRTDSSLQHILGQIYYGTCKQYLSWAQFVSKIKKDVKFVNRGKKNCLKYVAFLGNTVIVKKCNN